MIGGTVIYIVMYFMIQSNVMNPLRRAIAAAELVLVFPAVLFMTALFVRNLQPQPYEPAHTAQRIVMWYAANPHVGLWVLLIALPFIVLVTGGLTLLRNWRDDGELRQALRQTMHTIRAYASVLLVAAATASAAGILAIVALHVATD